MDRGKRGIKRSVVVDAEGIPLGIIAAPANRHDSPLLSETLDIAGELPERASVHLDRAYDSKLSRGLLERRSLIGVISEKGKPAPLKAGMRWVVENTLRRRLYKWVRQSSIKKVEIKPHDLRRTFGTWYLQENPGQVRELAELMGHSDLSQVMKYALSDEQRARAGVARL